MQWAWIYSGCYWTLISKYKARDGKNCWSSSFVSSATQLRPHYLMIGWWLGQGSRKYQKCWSDSRHRLCLPTIRAILAQRGGTVTTRKGRSHLDFMRAIHHVYVIYTFLLSPCTIRVWKYKRRICSIRDWQTDRASPSALKNIWRRRRSRSITFLNLPGTMQSYDLSWTLGLAGKCHLREFSRRLQLSQRLQHQEADTRWRCTLPCWLLWEMNIVVDMPDEDEMRQNYMNITAWAEQSDVIWFGYLLGKLLACHNIEAQQI